MSSSVAPGCEPQDLQRLLARHAAVGAGALLAFAARHVLAPARMQAVEIGLDDLRRLRIGEAAVLPEMRQLDGRQVLQSPAGEEALQHAAADVAGVVVELDLQVLGRHARGLARRFLRADPESPGRPPCPHSSHEPSVASDMA